MKVVIVGGVAGGASAAARARRLSEAAEIVVFERGPDLSFANCGLPYYVGGEIEDRSKLLVAKPEMLTRRHRLDIRPRTEVVSIDRAARTVRARELATGREYDEPYDRLILSPGASPIRPPIPGVDLPGVHTLRDLTDVDRLKAVVDGGARRAVVVGAGFIGLELAENLVRRGVGVALVELQDQVLPPMDREMTAPIAGRLRERGVDLRLSDSALAIERCGAGLAVALKGGDRLEADVVVLGVGVRPENGLAVAAGLEVAPRGGIRVDAHMGTADPAIYAVGDAVEIVDFVTGAPAQVPLAGPANRQGRVAADHIFGVESRYRGTQGTAIVGVFGLVAALTGQTEKALRRAEAPFEKVYLHPAHHAGYYPGARPMTLKVLFEPGTGKLLGAQGVGEEGVDKRIDVLAMAIQGGMSVGDLAEAELCYAPQFGSAKDPINMAGFIGSAVARGEYPQVYAEDLPALLEPASGEPPVVLDVRTPAEHEEGAIPRARLVPLDALRDRLAELAAGRPVIAYCAAGQRGYMATRILRQAGFDAANLAGGYKTYRMVVG